MDYILEPPLDVPGLEGVWEYNGLRLNDLATLERIRFTGVGGLQDDADIRESREANFDRPGEHAGVQQIGGRTITAEGVIEAGSIPSVRSVWRKVKSAFDDQEQDLKIHVPGEVSIAYNEIFALPGWSDSPDNSRSGWAGVATGTGIGSLSLLAQPDGTRKVIESGFVLSGTPVAPTNHIFFGGLDSSSNFGNGISWNGEDVYLSTKMRITAAPAVVSFVRLHLYCYDSTGNPFAIGSEIAAITASTLSNLPTLSTTTFGLSGRVAASNIPAGTVYIVPRIIMTPSTTVGTYAFHFWDIGTFLLKSNSPNPKYFDGDFPGFEWEGIPARSRSFGPVVQVNGVPDPKTADIRELTGTPTLWANGSSAGATINTSPIVWRGAGISGVAKAIYMKVTNPDTTARTIAIKPDTTTTAVAMRVADGRTYRATCTVKITQSASKAVNIEIVWLDITGATISVSTAAGSASTNEQTITVVGVAPASAVNAFMRVSFAATAAAQVFEWSIAKPVLIDITDYDPGSLVDFSAFDANLYLAQVRNRNGYPSGSQRRIPRPWLIKKVRKADRATSPEKQSDYRHRRDFMLSLRASDPRIHQADQQSLWTPMLGATAAYESAQPVIGSTPTSLPTGLSSSSLVAGDAFTNHSNSDPTNLQYYQGSDGSLRLRTTSTSSSGARIEYGNLVATGNLPWVRLRANPAMISSNPLGYGVVTILLLRVSATTYIQIDWVSLYNSPNQLSITKVVSGTPTSLATGSYPNRLYPPNTWFMAWIDGAGTVWAGIYTSYPDTSIDAVVPTPVLQVTYNLTSGEQSTFSSGKMGFGMGASFSDPANYPLPQHPGVMQYEAANGLAQSRGTMFSVPVIGDFDEIPLRLSLNGGLMWPTISITTPDGEVRSMSFKGLFGALNTQPTVLDFESGYFKDPKGTDKWDSVLPFYDRLVLRPGNNRVRVVAPSWLNFNPPAAVGVSWRNAVK
jgi:hypothetical protein